MSSSTVDYSLLFSPVPFESRADAGPPTRSSIKEDERPLLSERKSGAEGGGGRRASSSMPVQDRDDGNGSTDSSANNSLQEQLQSLTEVLKTSTINLQNSLTSSNLETGNLLDSSLTATSKVTNLSAKVEEYNSKWGFWGMLGKWTTLIGVLVSWLVLVNFIRIGPRRGHVWHSGTKTTAATTRAKTTTSSNDVGAAMRYGAGEGYGNIEARVKGVEKTIGSGPSTNSYLDDDVEATVSSSSPSAPSPSPPSSSPSSSQSSSQLPSPSSTSASASASTSTSTSKSSLQASSASSEPRGAPHHESDDAKREAQREAQREALKRRRILKKERKMREEEEERKRKERGEKEHDENVAAKRPTNKVSKSGRQQEEL